MKTIIIFKQSFKNNSKIRWFPGGISNPFYIGFDVTNHEIARNNKELIDNMDK